MPYPTRNGLKIYKSKGNGIKNTKKDGSFYVKSIHDGKLRLYTRKNKTGATKNRTLSPSSSSYYTARTKSKSKLKSKSPSNKTQHRRQTRSIRVGKINRESCGKNMRTNRCRFIRGNETVNKNCYLRTNDRLKRCVKVPLFNRTKCGYDGKTKRCQFLRKGSKASKVCKMSNGRCVKSHKSKRRKNNNAIIKELQKL
jgi:hypothetical protein